MKLTEQRLRTIVREEIRNLVAESLKMDYRNTDPHRHGSGSTFDTKTTSMFKDAIESAADYALSGGGPSPLKFNVDNKGNMRVKGKPLNKPYLEATFGNDELFVYVYSVENGFIVSIGNEYEDFGPVFVDTPIDNLSSSDSSQLERIFVKNFDDVELD